jgi:hypothetical protein
MNWINLAQDRDQWGALVNTVVKLWVPWVFGKFLCNCTTGGSLRKTQLHGVSYLAQLCFKCYCARGLRFTVFLDVVPRCLVDYKRHRERKHRCHLHGRSGIACSEDGGNTFLRNVGKNL